MKRLILLIILFCLDTSIYSQIYIRKGSTKYGEIIYNIDKH